MDRCIKCGQHKGTVPRPAPILEHPPPDRPRDVVSIDLLQLPASHQGSRYLLVCVDHLSKYVVLAPMKDKTAKSVAHALITHLICPFSTHRVLLSDNGTEFRNQLLEEICKQFGIKECFTVSYHSAMNGLVEHANRKILDVLRPGVSGLQPFFYYYYYFFFFNVLAHVHRRPYLPLWCCSEAGPLVVRGSVYCGT